MSSKYYEINQKAEYTKANRTHLSKDNCEYLEDDEIGHLVALSLGGNNEKYNLYPQNRDVNRRSYASVERGERYLAKNDVNVEMQKIAYFDKEDATRPSCFMVNDNIQYSSGKQSVINYSFTNASFKEQDEWNKQSLQYLEEQSIHYCNPSQDQINQLAVTDKNFSEIEKALETDYDEKIYYDYKNDKDITYVNFDENPSTSSKINSVEITDTHTDDNIDFNFSLSNNNNTGGISEFDENLSTTSNTDSIETTDMQTDENTDFESSISENDNTESISDSDENQ